MNRMLKRQRSEESAITLDYLHGIHQKHEEWLFAKNGSLGALPQSADSSAALSASASHWKYQGQSLPEAMRDQMNSSKSGTLHLHAVQEPEAIRGKVRLFPKAEF